MKLYELAYLISANLSEEEAKAVQEKIFSLIKDLEGIFEESFVLGGLNKKRLAYPIKKENEAYFGAVVFRLNPDNISKLEKGLTSEKQIFRYLLLIKKISIPTKQRVFRPERRRPVSRETAQPIPKKEKKVEIAEIEKKLEEILKE